MTVHFLQEHSQLPSPSFSPCSAQSSQCNCGICCGISNRAPVHTHTTPHKATLARTHAHTHTHTHHHTPPHAHDDPPTHTHPTHTHPPTHNHTHIHACAHTLVLQVHIED